MDIIEMFFPNGWVFIMIFFMIVGLIGAVGGAYIKTFEYTHTSIASFAFVLVVFSYMFYQITTSVIVEQTPTNDSTAAPATTQAPVLAPSQELVYFNGQAMSRAEHEHLLAYSTEHSPGDPE